MTQFGPMQPGMAQPGAPIPTRTLVIHSRRQPFIGMSWVSPTVLLDGHQFALGWGTRQFTIPADRPVHIQCEMQYLFTYGRAAAVLAPHHIAELEYSPPSSQWFPGELGAPGTTKTQGTWVVGLLLGIIGLCALLGIGAAVVAVLLS